MTPTSIRTGKAGKQYYVRAGGMTYSLTLTEDGQHVMLYTPTVALGGYKIERFNGALNPAGIRAFFAQLGKR